MSSFLSRPSRRNLALCPIVLAAVLALPAKAQEPLIVYEGFDYNQNANLQGLEGGTGWISAWTHASSDGVVALADAAQTYQSALGQNLPVVGRGLKIGRSYRQTTRLFPGRYTEGIYWFSVLLKPSAVSSGVNNTIRVHLRDNGTGRLVLANQNPTAENLFGIAFSPTTGKTAQSSVSGMDGATNFFVVRYEIGTTTSDGSIRLFINPADLSQEPAPASADAVLTALDSTKMAFDNIYLDGPPTSGGPAARYDEIRLGTSYYAVTATPQSSSGTVLSIR